MKKNKKKTSLQKRRVRAKAKSRLKEDERKNWVEHSLDWNRTVVRRNDTFHHSTSDEAVCLPYCSDEEDDDDVDDDSQKSVHKNDGYCKKGNVFSGQSRHRIYDFSIISWNVLADAYCRRSSHKNLPSKFQSRVFNRNQRQHQIRQTLHLFHNKLNPDLIALQEVDPPLEVAKCMRSLGYGVVESSSSSDGRIDRVDSCGLYFREDIWRYLNHDVIRLDDLAMLRSSKANERKIESAMLKHSRSIETKIKSGKTRDNKNIGGLKGFERSFVRKNVTLLVRLEHKTSRQQMVIVVSHLFWNPAYNYVKLCQAHYVAIRAKAFCKRYNNIPLIWCGDFNSQPNGCVHQYLTKGTVNAKVVAPWYAVAHKQHAEQKTDVKTKLNETGYPELTDQFDRFHITPEAIGNVTECSDTQNPKIRYLLDSTLNRFCRWLRILGLDAALETDEEEKERTQNGKIIIFQRCKDEGRSLITTASKLLNRKDCPPGTYLLDTKSLLDLESAIVHLLLSHGVKLEPKKILTRCVVCNGSIEPVHNEGRRRDILQAYQAPDEINVEVLDVYQCSGCFQGYWWCEKPTSSASRVKCQANRLLELCLRGGVPVDDQDLGMFGHIDVQKIRTSRVKLINENVLEEKLDVVKWLQVEDLRNPMPNMASAYALEGTQEESLAFTNVTFDFVGSLDYILYQTEALELIDRLYVPATFEELNNFNISNGHLLPSYDWPSDHLAIGCRMSFKQNHQNLEKVEEPKKVNFDFTLHSSSPPSEVEAIEKVKYNTMSSQTLTETYTSSTGDRNYEKRKKHSLKKSGFDSISIPPGPPPENTLCGLTHKPEFDSTSEPALTEASTASNNTMSGHVNSEKAKEHLLKSTKFDYNPLPPGPPTEVTWCSFIDEPKPNPTSEQTKMSAVSSNNVPEHKHCELIRGHSHKTSKFHSIPFPPGPPSPDPWCVFIEESKPDPISKQILTETSTVSSHIHCENVRGHFCKSSKFHSIPFPPGPPSLDPWCSFIKESKSSPISKQTLTDISAVSSDHLSGHKHCGEIEGHSCKTHSKSISTGSSSSDTRYGLMSKPQPDSILELAPPVTSTSSSNIVLGKEAKEHSACGEPGAKCACCITKIPSLFEMAELRRQHRLRLQNGN